MDMLDGVRRSVRSAATALATAVIGLTAAGTPLQAAPQQQGELSRDQEAIIQKSERLRDLMQTLLTRYRNEGRDHHVKLLEEGLEHLRQVGLLEDVAGVRDSLRNQALTEALRQQTEVVEELESLLAILRDRRSIENLEKEIETATRLTDTADQLLQRQTELQEQTRSKTEGEPSEAERALLEQLAELARQQRAESERNQRNAGTRAPFLEEALSRIEQLLLRQDALERTSERQIEGEGALSEQARKERFALGELEQAQRELFDRRSRDRALARAAQAARDLQQALESNDAEAERQALSQLQSRLDAAARRAEGETAAKLDQRKEELGELGSQSDQREALRKAAAEIQKETSEQADQLAQQSNARREELAKRLEEAANELARGKPQKPGSSSQAVAQAKKALEEASEAAEAGQDAEAMAKMSEASRALAEARKRHRRENPDARQIAEEMAGEASQVASGLRRTPAIDGTEAPEKQAAQALETAEQALRDAAGKLSPEATGAEAKNDVAQSRQQLEQARDQLQKAMQGETGDRQQEMQQAAARQEQLRQAAEQMGGDMQRGGEQGLSPEQQAAAKRPMQQAEDLMKKAEQSLQDGNQSTASRQQAQASEALDEAAQAVERSRPLSEEQKQNLQNLANEQKQIEEDIIRLAKEVEERNNRRAQQALQEAAQAAQRAQQAMQDGDREESDKQQEEARERLEEARDALEEERDRYQDLRMEELLFRMRDELVTFLEKQKPITQSTREAQQGLEDRSRMTRRVRRQLNDLGKEETELGSKAEYLRSALEEEGTLVFSHALKSNEEDLTEVARRLGGRAPDPGELTVMLQEDIEERTAKLIDALKREQERRQNEGGQGQNPQQDPGQNRPARPRLVPILAELQMLKQMEQDLMGRTQQMQRLVESRGADGITELETALMERLANRHNSVTRIFLQLKAQLEQAMQQPDAEGSEEKKDPDKGEGK